MITSKFEGRITGITEGEIPVPVEFAYDEHFDQIPVQMIFTQPLGDAVWFVDRELLCLGVTSVQATGRGDIKMKWDGHRDGTLLLRLESPEGIAQVALPRRAVVEFLERTTDAVPIGSEDIEETIDELIEEILNS